MIEHLPHEAIDKAWWDRCLDACTGPTWYARSHVLDAMSPGWEALADRERGAVMPLTYRTRMGVAYLFQPFALQRLGVFAPRPGPSLQGEFLRAVPARFKHWDIMLHAAACEGGPADVRLTERVNMELALHGDEPSASYNEGLRRGLRKWMDEPAPEAIDADTFLRALTASGRTRDWRTKPSDLRAFGELLAAVEGRGEGGATGVRAGSGWGAAVFIVRDGERWILLKGFASDAGRRTFALHRAIHRQVMTAVAAGARIFDFAGGQGAGLRRFYGGFGARPILYLNARVNRLRGPLRWYISKRDGA
jgi:hypothetical protein